MTLKKVESEIEKLRGSQVVLDTKLTYLGGSVAYLTTKFDNLMHLIKQSNFLQHNPEKTTGSQSETHDASHGNRFHYHHSRIPKLDFPRFDGDNPRSWIQKSERYFKINDTEEHLKVNIASIYLEGKAEKWFLNFQVNRPRITWSDLSFHICARFENPIEENFVGGFNKLIQSSTVHDYYEEFESLKALMLNMNPTLTESYFIMSFLSGLKEEIGKSNNRPYYSPNFPPKPILKTPKSAPIIPKSFSPSQSKSNSASPTIKRLTPEEVQKRRGQGLCYNCDAVYRPGNFCKGKQKKFMLQMDNSESQDTEEEEEVFEEAVESQINFDIEISLHALTGTVTGETIRIPGILNKHKVSILIDSGSTTSFIDSTLASTLHCTITPTASMLVIVANGDKTCSTGICSKLQWSMQGHKFVEDLRLLPLGGCDIVLGADWLKTLGDVLFNFSKLSISFKYHNKITLHGSTPNNSLLMMSGEAVKNCFSKTSHGIVGHLFSISTSTTQPTTPPELLPILDEYKDIFKEPNQLPPKRSLDHSIPLQPNAAPVNQRAYKCPYIQKEVVEKLVQDMLTTGIMQPSHSPFASPILLVKKKDNSWRFCVDYRKLNHITIKDKFPIPIIYELLDE
ncbi:uncharacterized protein LOC113273013 [Papaver somniferum]|uniref:uncharacterized protein LOC113273013 n=1 Tax=Papaver somniferum TaxID=3469 RepID=UPI000E6FFECE|nr:uncharacterized protein LOC113273013 [Papaver somniferum]